MTGHRLAAKRRSRNRRRVRKELVHAAGCTHRGGDFSRECAAVDCLPDLIAEATWLGVRIPRSLRDPVWTPELVRRLEDERGRYDALLAGEVRE